MDDQDVGESVTILIAEDNIILAKSISRCLRQSGYTTQTATSAAATRKALECSTISALCLDLQLPDGNGLDILDLCVRPTRKDMPVVIITGSGSESDRGRAERSGVLAFLIKPFALAELKSILDGALGDMCKTYPQISLGHPAINSKRVV